MHPNCETNVVKTMKIEKTKCFNSDLARVEIMLCGGEKWSVCSREFSLDGLTAGSPFGENESLNICMKQVEKIFSYEQEMS